MQRTQFAQTFATLAKLAASVWPRNWRDVDGPAEGGGGGVEPVPQPVGGQAAAAFGEQEVGCSADPGMGQGRLGAAQGDPFVQGGQAGRVKRHGPVGGELAERHFSASFRGGPSPTRSPARGRAVLEGAASLHAHSLLTSSLAVHSVLPL
jgi:hypothetical protein